MKSTILAQLILIIAFFPACKRHQPPAAVAQVTVFAAASTTEVLREAGKQFEAKTGVKVVFSFDSSSNLAKQIRAGAPADIFISADQKWMDDVVATGAIRADTRQDLLANELVLIAPAGKTFEVQMTKEYDFANRLPQVKRIAVGDPAHVPAGRYARQALESLGWWTSLESMLIPAQDVRAALRLVEIGEVDAGVVYSTDAQQSDKVSVIAAFPSESHEPIHYPIVQCSGSKAAADFIQFLRSGEMTKVFENAGFRVLPPPSGTPAAHGERP